MPKFRRPLPGSVKPLVTVTCEIFGVYPLYTLEPSSVRSKYAGDTVRRWFLENARWKAFTVVELIRYVLPAVNE